MRLLTRLIAIVLCGSVVVLAGRVEAEDACRTDAQRFCRKVAPGGGRIVRCLESHEAELAPACKAQIAGARRRVAGLQDACKADAEKLCVGVTPGGGRILQCLQAHEGELSADCKEALPKPR